LKALTKLFLVMLSIELILVSAELALTEIAVSTGRAFETNEFTLWMWSNLGRPLEYTLARALDEKRSVKVNYFFLWIKMFGYPRPQSKMIE